MPIYEKRFGTDLIFETDLWEVLLVDDQTYLGRCVVVLKRACGDLAEVTEAEIIDFLRVVKKMESSIRKAFGATMFNWTCLMNFAYQNNPPNPQVHWHLRPRCRSPVESEGETFTDEKFGDHYERQTQRTVKPEMREKIIQKIRENVK